MVRDVSELADSLSAAIEPGFRERLLAKGQAQSMIRRDGTVPAESQRFSEFLDRDLLDPKGLMRNSALPAAHVRPAGSRICRCLVSGSSCGGGPAVGLR